MQSIAVPAKKNICFAAGKNEQIAFKPGVFLPLKTMQICVRIPLDWSCVLIERE